MRRRKTASEGDGFGYFENSSTIMRRRKTASEGDGFGYNDILNNATAAFNGRLKTLLEVKMSEDVDQGGDDDFKTKTASKDNYRNVKL